VLSWAQHWSNLDRLINVVLWSRLIVSQQVYAFISSRDRDFAKLKHFYIGKSSDVVYRVKSSSADSLFFRKILGEWHTANMFENYNTNFFTIKA
jgi:hypothetical protein